MTGPEFSKADYERVLRGWSARMFTDVNALDRAIMLSAMHKAIQPAADSPRQAEERRAVERLVEAVLKLDRRFVEVAGNFAAQAGDTLYRDYMPPWEREFDEAVQAFLTARASSPRLPDPAGEQWRMNKDRRPAPHARYLVKRGHYTFVGTPCYGMHAPWWVPMASSGELEPINMEDTDEWIGLPSAPPHNQEGA